MSVTSVTSGTVNKNTALWADLSHAHREKRLVRVSFWLDDQSHMETWTCHVSELGSNAFWTAGRFLITVDHIEELQVLDEAGTVTPDAPKTKARRVKHG